jgi:hypothetical protein
LNRQQLAKLFALILAVCNTEAQRRIEILIGEKDEGPLSHTAARKMIIDAQ